MLRAVGRAPFRTPKGGGDNYIFVDLTRINKNRRVDAADAAARAAQAAYSADRGEDESCDQTVFGFRKPKARPSPRQRRAARACANGVKRK